MIDTLAGLHAAHELRDADGELLNVVHRDVSPQNILVGVDGISRITDFGIAFASARSASTRDGKLKGKFSYMAPEQVQAQQATRRMDIFTAGVVLWEAITGRPLFRRRQDAATINAVLRAPVPAPSTVLETIPAELDAVLLKALKRKPDRRYQTAAEFADALECLGIEGATHRAVAAFVEETIGPQLATRRAYVRKASDHSEPGPDSEFGNSDVHARLPPVAEVPLSLPPHPLSDSCVDFDDEDQFLDDDEDHESTVQSGTEAVDAIEHKRLRGLLAAAMLLLVGSAVGLLLARTAPEPVQPTPPTKPQPVAPADG
jgi:serine/threonine-protein kinase